VENDRGYRSIRSYVEKKLGGGAKKNFWDVTYTMCLNLKHKVLTKDSDNKTRKWNKVTKSASLSCLRYAERNSPDLYGSVESSSLIN